MNTPALLLYLGTNITVAGFTAYYFYKVLTTPAQKHDDKEA